MKTNPLKTHLALVTVNVIFGVNYLTSSYLLTFIGAGAWSFLRSITTFVLFVFFVGFPKDFKKYWFQLALAGLTGAAINQILFFEGLRKTTSTNASIIQTTVPLLTLVFAILLKKERFKLARMVGIVVGLIGLLILIGPENADTSSTHFLGDIFIFANAVSFSFYYIVSRDLNRSMGPMKATCGMFLFGTLLTFPYAVYEKAPFSLSSTTLSAVLCAIYGILGATTISYFLNNWALARTESSSAAVYVFIQPVVAGLISHFLYGEQITLRMILASTLVFCGVVTANFLERIGDVRKRNRLASH